MIINVNIFDVLKKISLSKTPPNPALLQIEDLSGSKPTRKVDQ